MKIENARVVGYTHDVSDVYNHRRMVVSHTEGDITLEVRLPRGYLDSLPEGFAKRKVTVTFEPTPGEAAYLAHTAVIRAADNWERLNKIDRAHWEKVAQAAIAAK